MSWSNMWQQSLFQISSQLTACANFAHCTKGAWSVCWGSYSSRDHRDGICRRSVAPSRRRGSNSYPLRVPKLHAGGSRKLCKHGSSHLYRCNPFRKWIEIRKSFLWSQLRSPHRRVRFDWNSCFRYVLQHCSLMLFLSPYVIFKKEKKSAFIMVAATLFRRVNATATHQIVRAMFHFPYPLFEE